MRIGLIRHFAVEEPLPTGWKTATELQAWRESYDLSVLKTGPADLGGVAWQTCLSSDLSRALLTAQAVFPGPIESTPLLREAQFATFRTGKLRLPVLVWRWLLQLAWLTGHASQRACRDEFRQRVQAIADRLCNAESDTLVVSHAGMMIYLSAELRARGFAGPKLRLPKHGVTYVYQN